MCIRLRKRMLLGSKNSEKKSTYVESKISRRMAQVTVLLLDLHFQGQIQHFTFVLRINGDFNLYNNQNTVSFCSFRFVIHTSLIGGFTVTVKVDGRTDERTGAGGWKG